MRVVISEVSSFECSICAIVFAEYRLLLDHLFFKHNSDSKTCEECGLPKWMNAIHVCGVSPGETFIAECSSSDDETSYEYEYCYCKKADDAPMIGCDAPGCERKWYHYDCIGILCAPDGDWVCPDCTKSLTKAMRGIKRQIDVEQGQAKRRRFALPP